MATIYEALRAKLGREPTHAETTAECRRIITEVSAELRTTPRPRPKRARPKYRLERTMVHPVPCDGAAHSNPYIDHCMLCLGFQWGSRPMRCGGEGCVECAKGNELQQFERKVRVA